MTPLKQAAEAYEKAISETRIPEDGMRAALLALAETDIFMAHSEAGAAELNADPTFNDQINADSAFKAILRSIASKDRNADDLREEDNG